jgi:hypothetical protein
MATKFHIHPDDLRGNKFRVVSFYPDNGRVGRTFNINTYIRLLVEFKDSDTVARVLSKYSEEDWELLHLMEVLDGLSSKT